MVQLKTSFLKRKKKCQKKDKKKEMKDSWQV